MKISTGIFTFLTIVWMAFIFILSSQNSDLSSTISDKFTRIVIDVIEPENKNSQISNTENNADTTAKKDTDLPMPQKKWFGIRRSKFREFIRKVAHFILFTVLGVLSSCIGLCEFEKIKYWFLLKSAGVSAVICTLYALIDEFHQHFVQGRRAEFSDVLIDCAGAFIGMFVCIGLYFLFTILKRKMLCDSENA